MPTQDERNDQTLKNPGGDEDLFSEASENRTGEFDLSEDELELGDDYISSALAAIENFVEPEEENRAIGTVIAEKTAVADDGSDNSPDQDKNLKALLNRIRELEKAISVNTENFKEKLSIQGSELNNARRVIRELRDRIEELEAVRKDTETEAEEFKRKWQETVAAYINYQKQSKKKLAEFVFLEKANILRKFLPVIDNMKRPMEFSAESESFSEGIRLIVKLFEDFLKEMDVTQIPAMGTKFDPYYHEAVDRVPNEELPTNSIFEELQVGYLLGEKVLRPARVSVSFRMKEQVTEEAGADSSDLDSEKSDSNLESDSLESV